VNLNKWELYGIEAPFRKIKGYKCYSKIICKITHNIDVKVDEELPLKIR